MELRDKIIEATIDEFNEKGLKFTMDQLAKRLGISKKTLYIEFKDKESLFLESIDRCFAEIKKSEKEIYENSSLDIIEKIKQIIIVLPEHYKTIDFRQLQGLEESYPKIYKKIERRIETDWEFTIELLEQGMGEGRIREVDINVLKVMVSSTIESFIRTNVLTKNKISYVDGLEQMIDIILKGITI